MRASESRTRAARDGERKRRYQKVRGNQPPAINGAVAIWEFKVASRDKVATGRQGGSYLRESVKLLYPPP
jgi:hypothetical protein